MRWIEAAFKTEGADIDELCEKLTALGAEGLVIEDEADFRNFLEANRQYWDYVDEDLAKRYAGVSRVKLYLPDDDGGRASLSRMAGVLGMEPDVGIVDDADWENNWKQYYRPIPVGERLLILPEWEPIPSDSPRRILRLDPGLAFGTGSHATTRMCLNALEKAAAREKFVLDIGCGSGALAIKAAKKYPQARVVGMDYWGATWDYDQSQCESNAWIEGVDSRTTFQKGDAAKLDFPDAYFDAAVSNFVFHEVRSQPDKAALIREALRVIKSGGVFAFEDVFFSRTRYPDLEGLVAELSKDVAELHFVDTRKSDFVPGFLRTPLVAGQMGLIYGVK
ncbi:MAG TPA: hypothetical protein DCZ10_10205 [Pelotomaculum sp.]|nr:hypothetical protein [Pelotomaculum sp.]